MKSRTLENVFSGKNDIWNMPALLGKIIEYQLKALSICEKVLPQDHQDIATTYRSIGDTYRKLGDMENAQKYLRKGRYLN